MIITRTPMRVSFVGGGTDIPAHYETHGGAVVSCTIDKYMYVMVNRKFDGTVRVSYAKTENVTSWKEVKHSLVKASMNRLGIESGVEIVSVADVPGRGTGLGSSSAFVVGLLNALNQYRILHSSNWQPLEDLAEMACAVEIEDCGKPIGKQDQYACAYGGLNYFSFGKKVDQIPIPIPEDLERHLMLFYTGRTRASGDILNNLTLKTENMNQMTEMAQLLKHKFLSGETLALGYLLDANWQLKKKMAMNVSNPDIDLMYETAKRAGAIGGKLCGAGGGGFLLLFARPNKHEAIKETLDLQHMPFKLTTEGSRVVYMEGFND